MTPEEQNKIERRERLRRALESSKRTHWEWRRDQLSPLRYSRWDEPPQKQRESRPPEFLNLTSVDKEMLRQMKIGWE